MPLPSYEQVEPEDVAEAMAGKLLAEIKVGSGPALSSTATAAKVRDEWAYFQGPDQQFGQTPMAHNVDALVEAERRHKMHFGGYGDQTDFMTTGDLSLVDPHKALYLKEQTYRFNKHKSFETAYKDSILVTNKDAIKFNSTAAFDRTINNVSTYREELLAE